MHVRRRLCLARHMHVHLHVGNSHYFYEYVCVGPFCSLSFFDIAIALDFDVALALYLFCARCACVFLLSTVASSSCGFYFSVLCCFSVCNFQDSVVAQCLLPNSDHKRGADGCWCVVALFSKLFCQLKMRRRGMFSQVCLAVLRCSIKLDVYIF